MLDQVTQKDNFELGPINPHPNLKIKDQLQGSFKTFRGRFPSKDTFILIPGVGPKPPGHFVAPSPRLGRLVAPVQRVPLALCTPFAEANLVLSSVGSACRDKTMITGWSWRIEFQSLPPNVPNPQKGESTDTPKRRGSKPKRRFEQTVVIMLQNVKVLGYWRTGLSHNSVHGLWKMGPSCNTITPQSWFCWYWDSG